MGKGVKAAAAQFGVSPSTLVGDHLSGCVVHGTHTGPAPYLEKDEEVQLVEYLPPQMLCMFCHI